MERGSVWRKWDLHVHTPDTALANEYGTWEEFLDALANETDVCVVGVTDYLSIEGYKRLVTESKARSFGSIKLLLPNIEFRVTPQTDKGHAINLHLLVDPTDPDHVQQIDSALARLTFHYGPDKFACTPSDLKRLGRAFDSSAGTPQKQLEIGTNQFKTDFSSFSQWLHGESWLRQNSLIAISGGNDGPSGIKDSGWAASKEQIWRLAQVVLTANEKNRNFWLCKDAKKDDATKLGGPKPCISASDAHSMQTLFRPAGDRFCWIKADPTFEGLRSILYEPDERIYIGKFSPIQHDMSRVIERVELSGSKSSGLGTLTIPLNSGLVSIIGAKGSGKSALADFIAMGGGCDPLADHSSFLFRAKNFVKGTKIVLHWADGSTTPATVGESGPKREMVRYLSQSFVEKLCAEDYAGTSLAEEIEKVIFSHLNPTDTLNASSFNSLRALRTGESARGRIDINAKIKSMIAEDEGLRSRIKEIPAKKMRIEE